MSFEATELQLYLFQAFPELEADNKKFDYASDRTKASCKHLIVDAYQKLQGKVIETTERVFGSQLKAKLPVSCLQILKEKTYEQAKSILYINSTHNIYPVLGEKDIQALLYIFKDTGFILTILSHDRPDIPEKAVSISLHSEKPNEPTPKQSSKNDNISDTKK
ncbi:MAG: hypothetical protein JSR97_03895 [Verrucomicrobia bacterium]|nr:hypothetical protein [Verrucomicrobiota bacterium]